MKETIIQARNLGKMYKLYSKSTDKVLDAFGMSYLLFWRKHHYQEFWALRDLSLEVKKGERLGIIGRNGAGKSTFLKVVTGNVVATEGEISVNGRVQALMELGTGFHPEFTGRENIRSSLAYQGCSETEIGKKEEEIIEFSELERFIDQPVKTYSAGMYARLAFSTATAVEPEILIIDEVLGAGDAYFSGKCVERMKKLTEESGATVLFVSHDLTSVQALCNRIIWIDRGQVRFDGAPLDVIKQYSTMIRQEEELRLRARDLKISKDHAASASSSEQIYEKFLFHIISQSKEAEKIHIKIRSILLEYEEQKLGSISVGSAMDNDLSQLEHILDDPLLMDWGSPKKDKDGYFREYKMRRGKYAHAPFEFSVPKSYLNDNKQFKLTLEANAEGEDFIVEIYSPTKKKYISLGILNPKQSLTKLTFSSTLFVNEKPELIGNQEIISAVDFYGSSEAIIKSVEISNSQDKNSKTLFSLEPFEISLGYNTTVDLKNASFVFCVYLPSGACASQWIASGKELGITSENCEGKVIFSGDFLYLGKGSYVASAAIFKYFLIDGLEPEAYHLLDRCIHFQVLNRDGLDKIDYGICRQPVKIELVTYD